MKTRKANPTPTQPYKTTEEPLVYNRLQQIYIKVNLTNVVFILTISKGILNGTNLINIKMDALHISHPKIELFAVKESFMAIETGTVLVTERIVTSQATQNNCSNSMV